MTCQPGPPRTTPDAEDGAIIYLAITLPTGIVPGDLADIQYSLADAARRTTGEGLPVRFVHGMYLPTYGSLLCAFSADDVRAVYAAAGLAGFPFRQVDAATASRLSSPPPG